MKRVVQIACAGALGIAAFAALDLGFGHSNSTSPVGPVARLFRSGSKASAHSAAAKPAAPTAFTLESLPRQYRILLSRSIFAPDHAGDGTGAANRPASADDALALRGIMQEGAGFIAFVENTAARTDQEVRIGDRIGRGRIVGIDLHAVRYATGGRAMRVEVGQTLSGGTAIGEPMTASLTTSHAIPD